MREKTLSQIFGETCNLNDDDIADNDYNGYETASSIKLPQVITRKPWKSQVDPISLSESVRTSLPYMSESCKASPFNLPEIVRKNNNISDFTLDVGCFEVVETPEDKTDANDTTTHSLRDSGMTHLNLHLKVPSVYNPSSFLTASARSQNSARSVNLSEGAQEQLVGFTRDL